MLKQLHPFLITGKLSKWFQSTDRTPSTMLPPHVFRASMEGHLLPQPGFQSHPVLVIAGHYLLLRMSLSQAVITWGVGAGFSLMKQKESLPCSHSCVKSLVPSVALRGGRTFKSQGLMGNRSLGLCPQRDWFSSHGTLISSGQMVVSKEQARPHPSVSCLTM
jgi:hypothetical protein